MYLDWEPQEMTDEEAAELEAHVAVLLREHLGIENYES